MSNLSDARQFSLRTHVLMSLNWCQNKIEILLLFRPEALLSIRHSFKGSIYTRKRKKKLFNYLMKSTRTFLSGIKKVINLRIRNQRTTNHIKLKSMKQER